MCNSASSTAGLYKLSWIGWLSTAVLFAIDPSLPAIPLVIGLSFASSAILIFKAPLLGLYLLPLPMMIGPIYTIPIHGIGYITAGDLYSVVLIARSLFMLEATVKKTEQSFLLAASILLLIGAAFSYNLSASIVGLIRILQYVLLIRLSIILIKNHSELRVLFNSWVIVSAVCSFIMLWHFFNGRPSLIFWIGDGRYDYSMDLSRSDVFFRSTFFYANIFIPIGLSLIYSFINILTGAKHKITYAILLLTFPVNLIALIMNNIRSMIVPVVALCGLILLWHIRNSLIFSKFMLRKIVLIAVVATLSVWFFFGSIISVPQRLALFERASNPESVILRISLWESVTAKMLDNPFRLIIGWGPQATTRQNEDIHIKKLLTGSLGNTDGAFDSTIIGFLVEYGIIFTTIIFSFVFIRLLAFIYNYNKTGDKLILSMLTMAVALLICHVFQQFTLSPPGLMALQVFALKPFNNAN